MRINPALLLGRTKREVITRPFDANNDIDPIPLTLPGYYTRVTAKFFLYVTAPSTPSPDADYPGQIMRSVKIEPTNVAPFCELDDGRQLYYEDFIRAEGSLYKEALPEVAGESKWVRWHLPIHFGDEYKEDYDISDVIAKRGLSNLAFKMKWGNQDDLGTGYTIAAADANGKKSRVELEICYVVLQPGIRETQAFPGTVPLPGRTRVPSFWQPQWHVDKELQITGCHDSLSFKKKFLNGFFLREAIIMVIDDTDALRDDIVTELQIADKEGKDFFTKEWMGLETDNMRDFHLSEPLAGVVWIDFKKIFHKTAAGIYLASADDLNWKFTIEEVSLTHPASIVIVYRTHYRVASRSDVVGERPAEFVA